MVLEVTAKEVFPAGAGTFWFCGVTPRVGAAPSWVTVTVTGDRLFTVTVMVAIRWFTVRFSVLLATIVPFPVPEAVTVHHEELLTAAQSVLEFTVKLVEPAGAGTFWLGGVTESNGGAPAWVTVTVCGGKLAMVTVISAILPVTAGFSV